MAHLNFARWIKLGIRSGLLLSAIVRCHAQSGDLPKAAEIDDDFVVVGGCGSEIIMATHGTAKTESTTCPQGWRCKRLSFAQNIRDFYLARTGTKLAILFEKEADPRIFDLSAANRPTTVVTHSIPRQRYRLRSENKELSFNDLGEGATDFDRLTEEFAVTDVLASSMSSACSATPSRWKLFHLSAEPDLYAPVLEFAAAEDAFPTVTSFWKELTKEIPNEAHWEPDLKDSSANKKQAQKDMLDRYLGISKEKKLMEAAVYYRVPARSYPGSWLFEYWTYYPFDTGHIVNHPHDTEHVFVEVDKLGGQVCAVLAAAHSANTPNNLYLATQPDAEPATLPLFVFVEKGKHAMAPDINRDHIFTPGVDVNMSAESPQVWGVRDVIGQTDSHMRSYESVMTLPRDERDAWATLRFNDYYSAKRFPNIKPAYRLEPLPGSDTDKKPADFMSGAFADYKLRQHPDYRNPANIYKPWVFPVYQMRLGYTNINYGRLYSVGFVTDLYHLPMLSKFRLPGRIDIELMLGRSSAQVNEEGEAVVPTIRPGSTEIVFVTKKVQTGRTLEYSGLRLQYGIQYERPTSNLFGYFAAFYRRYDAFSNVRVMGTQTPDSTPYPLGAQPLPSEAKSLGQFGVFVEVPKARNLVLFAGPVFTDPGRISAVFFRVTFSPWRSRRRQDFGF
jgi:hypothetical protein